MSSIKPRFINGIFRQARQATPEAVQQLGLTFAKRNLVQQTLGSAASTPATAGLPANLTAAALQSSAKPNAAQLAAQQAQVLIDAKAGDVFGTFDDAKPLVANQTFVGSKAKPSDLNQSQLQSIATSGTGATPNLPPPGSEPTTSNQGRSLFTRSAQMRGLSADALAAELRPAQSSSAVPVASSAQSANAQTISKSAVLSKLANMRPDARSFTGGAVSAKSSMLASPSIKASAITAATLGAAAPIAGTAAAANDAAPTANDSGPSHAAGLDGLGSTSHDSRAQRVTDAAGNGAAPTTSAASTRQADATKNAPPTAFEKGRAAAVKRGDASVGATFGGSDAAFNKKLAEAWAEVDKAGKAQHFSGPINWQSFFNILAARNAKLIGMFIELMAVATQIENQTTMDALKLDKESKASNIEFDKAQAMLQVARAIFSLQDATTSSANRIVFNQSRFLTSQELDLQAGLGERQMQAPIQKTFQESFVGQLAGDPTYRPLLQDSTQTARMADFRTDMHTKIARDNPAMSQDDVHKKAAQTYATAQAGQPAETRIINSYTKKVDGVDTQVPIPRRIVSSIEEPGLSQADKARNTEVMRQVHKTMEEDVPARAQMYLAEIQNLESAMHLTDKPSEIPALKARADSFRAQYNDARASLRGVVDVANPIEKRFDETMRNRGAVEVIRRKAEAELGKLQAIIEPADEANATSAGAREHAKAQKAVYQAQVDVINGKLAILDDDIKRHIDPKGDNRRGRFQTGAEGVTTFYRQCQTELAAAQTTLAAHPNPSDKDHLAAQKKIQNYAQRLGELESYPAYFKNPIKLHEALYTQMLAHQRTNGGSLSDLTSEHPLFATFSAAVTAGPGNMSREGVSKTRMITHLRQRSEELKHLPDTHPEKQAIKVMDTFWRKSPMWDGNERGGGYAPPLRKDGFVGAVKDWGSAAKANIKLRGERNTAEGIPNPQDIPNRPSEQYWLNADGTPSTTRVNFSDPDEVSRYHSARAATNGNILGIQGQIAGGGGAYRNNSGRNIEMIENTLTNLATNAGSHLETMESFVTNSAQGLSSDAQESLSEFMSTIAQARQQANGLLLQMYQLANAKVGH